MLAFLVLDLQGFMYSGWAVWVLIGSLLIPYSIAYTADLLRRRGARRGEDSGDSSLLVFTEVSSGEASLAKSSALDSSPRSDTVWIWVGLAFFAAYAVVRIVWALLNGADVDWTVAVALVAVAGLATILPSAIGWQRFRRSAIRIGGSVTAWPTLRTDQFASELYRSRPGAIIPQDLILAATESAVSVWTTYREPKLLLSLPRDAATIRAVTLTDRLGSTGIRIEHHGGEDSSSFDLVVRRTGTLTYFRANEGTVRRCVEDMALRR
jgi:hypothetical protein